MYCEVHFEMDNAAFEDDPLGEPARILRRIADQITNGDENGPITDINGNVVGSWFCPHNTEGVA